MGIQILNKDVSVISRVTNIAKANIGSIFGKTGWSGGGGGPASQGPLIGSTAISDPSVGTVSWTNPTSVFDTTFAYGSTNVILTTSQESEYIKATNFGFSIPSGATINGIIVNINRYADDQLIEDNAVRIVKGGTIGTTNKAKSGNWPNVPFDRDIPAVYGSSTDLWGETWTSSDINSSDFGFAISAKMAYYNKFNWTAYLFGLNITVHYTT